MTPFPTTSTMLPPEAPLSDHEVYTRSLMTQQAANPSASMTPIGSQSLASPGQQQQQQASSNLGSTGPGGLQKANYSDSFMVDIRIP